MNQPSSRSLLKLATSLTFLAFLTSILHAADVNLAWDANSEPDVAGYRIYFGTPAGNFTDMVDAGNTTATTLQGLTSGATYSFYATCYNTTGLESEPSNIVQYTIPTEEPVSHTPVALDQAVTVIAGTLTEIPLRGTDPDGDPLTFNLTSFPQVGQITSYAVNSSDSATITYIAPEGYTGEDSFTFDVNDGYETSLSATIAINVMAATPLPGGTPTTEMDADIASLNGTMTLLNDPEASNGTFFSSPIENSGSATFTFMIAEEADYVVWCRVKTPSPAEDSFTVTLDNDPSTTDIFDASQEDFSDTWKWTPLSGRGGTDQPYALPPYAIPQRVFHLLPGVHTLTFEGREANTGLDTIVVTSEVDYLTEAVTGPRITRTENLGAGFMFITWSSSPGSQYRLHYKDGLDSIEWLVAPEIITATEDYTSYLIGGPLSRHQFYRIEELP